MTHVSDIGWFPDRVEQLPAGSRLARVVRVDRGRLTVLTQQGERWVRPGAWPGDAGGSGAPAVGDWVAVEGERVVAVLPRRTAFTRTVAGRTSAPQVVAANVDVVLVVEALAGAPRIRRVERYLAVAWGSGATPVVVLTKADLCDDVAAAIAEVVECAPGVEVLAVSALTGYGVDPLRELLAGGRTGALVGPSGAGKSSLVNALAGGLVAETGEVRDSDGRGRHTTTARQLHLLPGGGALVDTPGLRELALYDDAEGVDTAFADIADLALRCRFGTAATAPNRAARSRPPSTAASSTPPATTPGASSRPRRTGSCCAWTRGRARRSAAGDEPFTARCATSRAACDERRR